MNSTHYIERDPDTGASEMELLRNQIVTLSSEQILRILGLMEENWYLGETAGKDMMTKCVRLGYDQFFDPSERASGFPTSIDIKAVDGKRDREIKVLKNIGSRVKALAMTDYVENESVNLTAAERVCRLIKQVSEAFKNVRLHLNTMQRIKNPREMPDKMNSDPEYFDATPMDETRLGEMTPFQRAIVACLDEAYKKHMRRYKGECYVQRISEGAYTRSWKQVCAIPEFVYEFAEKEVNFDFWKDITSRGNTAREVINYLSNCIDSQFPEIIKDRHVWSFKNGLFIGKEWQPKEGKYACRFYPYESKQFRSLDPTLVSCKFFDQFFDDYNYVEDWWDIPTPYFQSIFDYQSFDEEVSRWAYVMGGRLCFDVGELDGWQVIPFFKGIARSGKSTVITKVFRKFYESNDVRTLSNNIEKKFGLSSIYDSFMFIAPEVKGDLSLEQAEFQSLVSGEDVSIAVKHQNAISIQWSTPGVLGGNEVPSWKDNSGSVLRRILPWNFRRQVREADPHLDQKLEEELPAILLKCVRAYLEYSAKYSDKDIWNVVPEYFKSVQKEVAKMTSTIHHFLEDTSVQFGKDLFVPQSIFLAAFNQHCQMNNLGKPRFNEDSYAGAFSQRDITVTTTSLTYRGRMYNNQKFIHGLDVIQEELVFE
jgi:succinate dehydrogenase flavin-adding protein (antitoxin of CptAB toxin-antitoxin module)